MALREAAWRVSARELESSLEEERGSGERAAGYVLSPFGARMNRVLLAGTLSPAEPIGREEAQTFWRARLSDPTGAVAITAGSFQPRAMAQLRAAREPRPAVVVGKVHLYRGRDGVGYVSVRAEAVRSVSENDERALLADMVRQTLDRLELVERIEKAPSTTEEALRSEGVPSAWVRAAHESLRRYPDVDRAAFRRELVPGDPQGRRGERTARFALPVPGDRHRDASAPAPPPGGAPRRRRTGRRVGVPRPPRRDRGGIGRRVRRLEGGVEPPRGPGTGRRPGRDGVESS